jgi:cysteine desulfurase
MLYLDANATEPLRPEARAAMLAAADTVGNPSSIHAAGRAARRILEDAREVLATRFGARPADIVFTSGGTEANALAIRSLGAGRRIIIGATEHDAVRSAAPDATILPVDGDGVADLQALAALLADAPPALVCLMWANNETGVVQPIAEAAAISRHHGALLHVDAVQAAGRIPVELGGVHSLAISSHKLGGPSGAGALLLAPEAAGISPLIAGGGQERGRRGGTHALPAIAGFAAAATPLAAGAARRIAGIRDAIGSAAIAAGATVCGGGADRLPNTTCLALPGIRADAQVMGLDLDGICVSAGAACSSGKVAASHVLMAMGLGPLAAQAIRVSLPWNVTADAVPVFAAAYARMADRLRAALAPRAA